MLPNFNQVQAEEDTTRVIKQLQTLDRDEALGVAAIYAYLSMRPSLIGGRALFAWGMVLIGCSIMMQLMGGWRWWILLLPLALLTLQAGAFVWMHREATRGYQLVKDKVPPRYLAAAVCNRAILDVLFHEGLFKGGRNNPAP